jgi:hypothetical protein
VGEELIRADRRITIDSVATALGWSHGFAYSILYGRLKFRKECARCLPRERKDREKINRIMGLSLQHLLRYADEREDMLNRIVTGYELWVHHYLPESKRVSMQSKHPSTPSHSTKKFKVTPSAAKVILIVIWDSSGVLFAHF